MINLFDYYTVASRDLQFSLETAGLHLPTVVIHDDGFLPRDVQSPLEFFLQEAGTELIGKPRYFNQIDLPKFWEIDANGVEGRILDKGRLRGHITYSGGDRRFVKQVEWNDRGGVIRSIDHYNQWGQKYAVTTLTPQGQPALTTYFTPRGKELLVLNHGSGSYVYHRPDGREQYFASLASLVGYYLWAAKLPVEQVNFNSLATPILTIQSMGQAVQFHRLFWQEPIQSEVPGNMKFILSGHLGKGEVVVQSRADYERLKQLLPANPAVKYLGYVYPFQRLNQQRKTILILTNSDQVVGLEELANQLPDFSFAVAAVTEMSSHLMELDRLANVHLYPTVSIEKARQLLAEADIYLDINRGKEILDAVRGAFENNLLILGWQSTLHAARYVAADHCFIEGQIGEMVGMLRAVYSQPNALENALQEQWRAADRELPQAYRDYFRRALN